jgi:hypothetical protein
MKRILAFLLLLILLPITSLANERFNMILHSDYIFLAEYSKASQHEDTAINTLKWVKNVDERGKTTYQHNQANKFYLILDTDRFTGEITRISTAIKYRASGELIISDKNVNRYFLPAAYRILNMFESATQDEFLDVLERIGFMKMTSEVIMVAFYKNTTVMIQCDQPANMLIFTCYYKK